MLRVQNLNVYYGVIHALHDVSLEVAEGDAKPAAPLKPAELKAKAVKK